MSMSRRATIAGFLVLVLGVIVLYAMGVGGGSKLADTRAPASSSATGGTPYDKVCLVETECDLGQGILTVTGAHYTDSYVTDLGKPGGGFVAVEFTYEYTGSLGSVDVRRLPFVLEDDGGDLHEYDPSLTREYAMSRGLVMAYGDGDGGYGTVHYELSMPGAAVFMVPDQLREDLALYAMDVVSPRRGDAARIELTPWGGSPAANPLPCGMPGGPWPAQDVLGCSASIRFARSTAGGITSPIPIHDRSVTVRS
jgi:hypothetical protein